MVRSSAPQGFPTPCSCNSISLERCIFSSDPGVRTQGQPLLRALTARYLTGLRQTSFDDDSQVAQQNVTMVTEISNSRAEPDWRESDCIDFQYNRIAGLATLPTRKNLGYNIHAVCSTA